MKECNICHEIKDLACYYKTIKKDGTYYYYPYCKKCAVEKSKTWNKTQKEKRRKILERYESKEHRKEDRRKWSKIRRENGKYSHWQNENKDKISEYNQKRRTEKTHNISENEWEDCLEFFGNSCAYCGMSIEEHIEKYKQTLHREHVDDDGSNGIENCIPSCRVCNSNKWTFDMEEWYKKQKFFSHVRLKRIKEWVSK